MKKLVVVALLGSLNLAAFALPAYDPFADATGSGGTSYTVGATLYGTGFGQTNSQGLNWFQAGPGTGSQVTIASGNLSVPGLMPSTGNSISFGGSGTSARFGLGGSISSGTLYYSFAFQLSNTNGMNTSGVFWAGFNNSTGSQLTTPSSVNTRVITKLSGTGFQVGLDKSSGLTGNFQFDPTIFGPSDTIFVVGKYTWNTGTTADDVSMLWVNPSSASFGGTEPGGALTSTTTGDVSPVASFVFFNRSTAEPAGIIADELRVGTTWADVTPTPEPATPILLGLGLLAALVRYRSARR